LPSTAVLSRRSLATRRRGITGNGMARTGIAWRTQSPALCSKVVFAMPGGSP
jgi:hypothetical protein